MKLRPQARPVPSSRWGWRPPPPRHSTWGTGRWRTSSWSGGSAFLPELRTLGPLFRWTLLFFRCQGENPLKVWTLGLDCQVFSFCEWRRVDITPLITPLVQKYQQMDWEVNWTLSKIGFKQDFNYFNVCWRALTTFNDYVFSVMCHKCIIINIYL